MGGREAHPVRAQDSDTRRPAGLASQAVVIKEALALTGRDGREAHTGAWRGTEAPGAQRREHEKQLPRRSGSSVITTVLPLFVGIHSKNTLDAVLAKGSPLGKT